MKKIFFVLIISYFTQILFSQEVNENRFEGLTERFHNGDNGIILNKIDNPEDEYNNFVEKLFVNKISNNKMYYTGDEYRGGGIFWIYNNGEKEIILETNIRYGPKIIWHGENIAEIIIPTGSPFTHSYFYDFDDNQISSPYNFPIYYDIEYKVILIWGNSDFELYDIKTGELLKIYNSRRMLEWNAFWPYIQYYIEKEESTIILYYNDLNKGIKGEIKLEIIGKINGA
jgi:hypothetical protein